MQEVKADLVFASEDFFGGRVLLRNPWQARIWLLIFLIVAFLSAASAQSPLTDDPAPPPLPLISKGERSQLDSQPNPKRRLETAFQLMNERIKKAEELKNAENFDAMFAELGGFHGLIDYTLDFITKEHRQRGKALNFFKRFEIGLRGFRPRLELIRRDLPGRYLQYLSRLLKYLREARSKAIEPFFGDTVVPNRPG